MTSSSKKEDTRIIERRKRIHSSLFAEPRGVYSVPKHSRFNTTSWTKLFSGSRFPESVSADVECIDMSGYMHHGTSGSPPTLFFLLRHFDEFFCVSAKSAYAMDANGKFLSGWKIGNKPHFNRAWYEVSLMDHFPLRGSKFETNNDVPPITAHRLTELSDPITQLVFEFLSQNSVMFDDEKILQIGIDHSEPMACKSWELRYDN